jgi:hypothetical protein
MLKEIYNGKRLFVLDISFGVFLPVKSLKGQ